MGQEVKNPFRAQSKYGLMGSSAKTGKNFFRGSPEHFFDKNAIWDRTPPHLHINCRLHVWGRVQGSQIFKRNSIILIHSKVMAFLVILLSPWSPCCPHVIPVIPMSSPCHPCHPHIIPIALKRSSCGPHGLWSPWSPPHVVPVVPVVPTSSHVPHIIPMWSLSSPHCLEDLHIISNPQIPTLPTPHPGVGAPNQ